MDARRLGVSTSVSRAGMGSELRSAHTHTVHGGEGAGSALLSLPSLLELGQHPLAQLWGARERSPAASMGPIKQVVHGSVNHLPVCRAAGQTLGWNRLVKPRPTKCMLRFTERSRCGAWFTETIQ